MNNVIRTTIVIARKKIKETLLSPAFYIILVYGFFTVYIISSGFTGIIGSDGINPEKNALFEIFFSFLSGISGESFLERLFAEGPFVLILYISVLPFILYLALSSLFKTGYERITGALELVVYGPIGVLSYILGSFFRNLFFICAYLVLITLLSLLSALITNMVIGPVFFASLLMLFFLSVVLFALCIFCSVIPRYTFASFALFLLISAFFIILQMGTLASAGGYVYTFWSVIAGIIKFISPMFYFMNGITAIDYGDVVQFMASSIILIIMSGVYIIVSFIISGKRGVTL